MSIWERITLDKLGKIVLGVQRHTPMNDEILFENGDIPFIEEEVVIGDKLYIGPCKKNYNQIGLKQSKLFPDNTVCITKHGRIGDSSISKTKSCLSIRLFGFISFENISDCKFIKYCFNYSKIRKACLKRASANTTTKSLDLNRILKIPFPNPPFELQQKIGKILSIYDLLIENYQRQIEEAKKQVISKMICSSQISESYRYFSY